MEGNTITQQIMAIQRDPSLTDVEKAKKRQELLSGKWARPQESATGALLCMLLSVQLGLQHLQLIFQTYVSESQGAAATVPSQPAMFDDSLKCAMCMDLCARPVTVSLQS